MKTWDVLDRETGAVLQAGQFPGAGCRAVLSVLERWEVAYCRETGEVVYR